ncbi:hypothetical protein ACQ0QQ_13680 [Lysinibacillus sphaericus]
MNMKIIQIIENLAGGLLLSWAVFQAFYFPEYGYETELGYYVNIAGPALFCLWLLTLAIKHGVKKDFKKFSLFLLLAIFIAYVSAPFVL